MDIESQGAQILSYLREGNSLTPLEALNKFGCFRLGARIWDLKREGHDIHTDLIEANGKRVASYRLRQPHESRESVPVGVGEFEGGTTGNSRPPTDEGLCECRGACHPLNADGLQVPPIQ